MSVKRRSLCLIALLSALRLMPGIAAEDGSGEAVRAAVGADGKQRVAILGGSYFFKPDHIVVKVNTPVELSVKREWGIVPHTFVMKVPEWGLAVDEDLSTDAKVIAFTPRTVGKYAFYCRNRLLFFKSHENKGMKGVLEVVP